MADQVMCTLLSSELSPNQLSLSVSCLPEIHRQMQGTDLLQATKFSLHDKARLHTCMQEQGVHSKAKGADKLTAVLQLQCELEAAREQAAQREGELREELQQVRRDKQEMEARLGGLDVNKMEVYCYCCHSSAHSDALPDYPSCRITPSW